MTNPGSDIGDGTINLGSTIFLNEYINKIKDTISNPGTNGPRNTVNEGAITASTEVEQHTAEDAKADADAEIEDVPVEALDPRVASSCPAFSSITVHILGKVNKAAYNNPDNIEITIREIPGSYTKMILKFSVTFHVMSLSVMKKPFSNLNAVRIPLVRYNNNVKIKNDNVDRAKKNLVIARLLRASFKSFLKTLHKIMAKGVMSAIAGMRNTLKKKPNSSILSPNILSSSIIFPFNISRNYQYHKS
ncbi:MAG: hypothetical protein ACC656_07470 [Candidatus Heimdallarchaeota archaeon]